MFVLICEKVYKGGSCSVLSLHTIHIKTAEEEDGGVAHRVAPAAVSDLSAACGAPGRT